MISQEEIKRIKNLKGLARGQTIINALEAILVMEGKEGLKRLEEKLKEIGSWVQEYNDFPKNIKIFEWYPLWYDILPIVVAADLFNWNEEKIRQFGVYNQKVSFFEKVFLKYFITIKIAAKAVSGRWRKHYSLGEFEATEINEKEKRVVLTLNDFPVHPVFCRLLEGYIQSAAVPILATEEIKCREIKCNFRGDAYHQFLLTWR